MGYATVALTRHHSFPAQGYPLPAFFAAEEDTADTFFSAGIRFSGEDVAASLVGSSVEAVTAAARRRSGELLIKGGGASGRLPSVRSSSAYKAWCAWLLAFAPARGGLVPVAAREVAFFGRTCGSRRVINTPQPVQFS